MNNNKKVDSLSYEGIVVLKTINEKTKKVKRENVIHNNGTDSLFFFLCKCLADQYDKNYGPLAIDAADIEYVEGAALKSSLAYRVLLSNQGVVKDFQIALKDSDGKDAGTQTYAYATRFSAIIPYSAILNNAEGKIQNPQLHSSLSQADKVESLLAYVNPNIEIKDGEALLIEWNMGFKNPTQEDISTNTKNTDSETII